MDKRTWDLKILWGILVFLGGILLVSFPVCYGKESGDPPRAEYENPDTGYEVFLEDEAGLLLDDERLEVLEVMKEITKYGNAAFVTVSENSGSTERFARTYYGGRFGTDSGTVLVIDMDKRMIWIHSDGAVYRSDERRVGKECRL